MGGSLKVTVIDPRKNFVFTPNIHEIISGVKRPHDLEIPLNRWISKLGHSYINETVEAVDISKRSLTLSNKENIEFDILVLAVGFKSGPVDLSQKNAQVIPLKSLEDVVRIKNRLAELEGENRQFTVNIVGGGYIGVECLGGILRRYPTLDRVSVNIIETADNLLHGSCTRIKEWMGVLAENFGFKVFTNQHVKRFTDKTLILENGLTLKSDLSIWTAGIEAPAILAQAGLANTGHWAPTRSTLQSLDYDNILVIGDAANVIKSLKKQAYHALDMGSLAGKNINRLVLEHPLNHYKPRREAFVITFGNIATFYEDKYFQFSGKKLFALREWIFQTEMKKLESKLGFRSCLRSMKRLKSLTRRESVFFSYLSRRNHGCNFI